MSFNPLYVGAQSTGTSIALVSNYTNSSATPIPQGTPVSKTGAADLIAPTDVSDQTSVQRFVGYAQFRIGANALGPVISGGRLQTLTGYSFSIGDSIYISTTGSLQNTKPVDGNGNPVAPFTSGDSMIFSGVIVQNETNPSNQDLQILTQVLGVL